jgi:hypothetical protein
MKCFGPLVLPVLASLVLGCSTVLWETGLPWTQAEFTIDRVERRGPFLDVALSGGGIERRFFARGTDVCREMLKAGERVTLKGLDAFVSGESECPIAGIGDLEQLRGSRSRGGGYGSSPIRRGNDRIEFVYEDEQYRFARGGFSIAAMFGWSPGTDQVVALLPRVPECASVTDGFVSVVFREAGSPALGIPVADGTCPIRGLLGVRRDEFP